MPPTLLQTSQETSKSVCVVAKVLCYSPSSTDSVAALVGTAGGDFGVSVAIADSSASSRRTSRARSSNTFMNEMKASWGVAYGLKYLCTSPSENHLVHM